MIKDFEYFVVLIVPVGKACNEAHGSAVRDKLNILLQGVDTDEQENVPS